LSDRIDFTPIHNDLAGNQLGKKKITSLAKVEIPQVEAVTKIHHVRCDCMELIRQTCWRLEKLCIFEVSGTNRRICGSRAGNYPQTRLY